MPVFSPVVPRVVDRLRALVGEDGLRLDEVALEIYGRDQTEELDHRPEVVVLPRSVEEVAAVVRLASQETIPVTPRAAGTGLSGGALPVHGGILLSVERLNRVRHIDTRNLLVEAEVGVVTAELQRQVEDVGLFYPPDPASRESCQLGGNLAEDSGGPRSCKYGTTRRYVLGLEAVLADGSVVRTGGENRKDVTGYNLTQLLVGSEGTLAVLTAATLRLLALPRASLTLLAPFSELEEAAAAVEALFRRGHDPAACELLDENALLAVSREVELPPALRDRKAVLLLELDGREQEEVLEAAASLEELLSELGAGETLAAQDPADQRRLWQIRRKVGEAVRSRGPVRDADTVVPRSKLAELVHTARRVAREHDLAVTCFGHAGDGNLHVLLLAAQGDGPSWRQRRKAAEAELFRRVVELGGTISAEHGIGWTQREHVPLALSPPLLELMRRVKSAFDPKGILNPGKVFPA